MVSVKASFTYKVFLLFILCNPLIIRSQVLKYRQGELIVQIKPNASIANILNRQEKMVNHDRPSIKLLSEAWAIYLLKYDFTKHNEIDLLNQLSRQDEVLNVQRNGIINYRKKPNDIKFYEQWYHNNDGSAGGTAEADFDTDLAWDLSTGGITENGDSIVICIIDDGIDTLHDELIHNFWKNKNEVPYNGLDDDHNGFTDDYRGWNSYKNNDRFNEGNHGTPVCGLACAEGNNTLGIAGINWNSQLLFVEGGGDEANAILAYSYPWKMRKKYNESGGKEGAFVVVTSCSWGINYGRVEDAPIWCAIYDSLGKQGILNIAATINANVNVDLEGDLPTTCPSEFLIAVTNMNWNNMKEDGSGYGIKSIDLGSYGENVISTSAGNSYRTFGGTSAATPLVAGAIALFYSLPCIYFDDLATLYPDKVALEMKELLLENVHKNSGLKGITKSEGVMNIFQSATASGILRTEKIGADFIDLQFINHLLSYPILLEWKKTNSAEWNSIQINNDNLFRIEKLEQCEDYEFRYKFGCTRFEKNFSATKTIRTLGCCLAPKDISINQMDQIKISLGFNSSSLSDQMAVILHKQGEAKRDTIIYKINNQTITIDHLEACSKYYIQLYSFCGQKTYSDLSDVFEIKTNNCAACTDMNYCKRIASKSNLEWIESIKFNAHEYKSGNNEGFGNFISSEPQFLFNQNSTYEFTLTAGYLADSSQLFMAAWIDFNQDGDFEPSENITVPALKFIGTYQKTILIPQDAKAGITRMRIAVKYAETSDVPPIACNNGLEFGEYEDYCVYIYPEDCTRGDLINISKISNTSCELNNVNEIEIQYWYHKKQEENFIFGSTLLKNIVLLNLDSCSSYELYYKPICQLESGYSTIRFDTKGLNCDLNTTEDKKRTNLNIFPNPVNNSFRITGVVNIKSVSIISVNGIETEHVNSVNDEYPFNLQSGVYFVKIVTKDGKVFIRKIIKL